MTVLDDIRRFWHVQQTMMGLSTKLEWVQRGGSIRYVGNHPIHIREVKDGTHIFLYSGPSKPCFCLELLLKERHAILQGVRRRTDCFVDKHSDSRNIISVAVALAKERGMITIELTDNSTIRPDLSFLTTGKTWYESILPNLNATETPKLELWRSRVLSNTWRKVGAGLPMFDTTGIDIDEPGSAMAVLARADYAAISANMDQLLEQSGILSLHGRHWFGALIP